MGRSLSHLVETVQALAARGVGFRSFQKQLDTTTSGGRLIFHIFASLAEFERDLIRERTNAGLAAARAWSQGGTTQGRRREKAESRARAQARSHYSIKEICEIVGISRNTYYKYTRTTE